MLNYILTLSILIAAIIAIRAIFRRTASSRVIYALWLAVVIRLCLPFSLFHVALPQIPSAPPVDGEIAEIQQSQETPDDVGIGNDMVMNEQVSPDVPVPSANDNSIVQDAPESQNVPDVGVMKDNAGADAAPSFDQTPDEAPAIPSEEIPVSDETPIMVSVKNYIETIAANMESLLKTVWLAGSVLTLVIFAVSLTVFNVRLMKNRKHHSTDGKIKIYSTDMIASPCIAGLIPSIYITPDCDAEALPIVILHERTHIRHGDSVWSLVRCAALVIHWWNPLVWAAVILSKRDAELACDEAVTQNLDSQERINYARIIVDMIPVKSNYAIGMNSAPIKERITMIMKTQKNKLFTALLAAVMAVSAVGCSFISAKDTEQENATDLNNTVESTDTEVVTKAETEAVTEIVTEATTEAETETTMETEEVTETETTAAETTALPATAAPVTTAPPITTVPPVTDAPVVTTESAPPTPDRKEFPVGTQKLINTSEEFKNSLSYVYGSMTIDYNKYYTEELQEYLDPYGINESPINIGILRLETLEETKFILSLVDADSNEHIDYIKENGWYDESFYKDKSLIVIFKEDTNYRTAYGPSDTDLSFDGTTLNLNIVYDPYDISYKRNHATVMIREIAGRLPKNIEYKAEYHFHDSYYWTPSYDFPETFDGIEYTDIFLSTIPSSLFLPKDTILEKHELNIAQLIHSPAELKEFCSSFDKKYLEPRNLHLTVYDTYMKDRYNAEFFENNTLGITYIETLSDEEYFINIQLKQKSYSSNTLTFEYEKILERRHFSLKSEASDIITDFYIHEFHEKLPPDTKFVTTITEVKQ